MRTAAVILNWNRAGLTAETARSVRGQVDTIYLVDNHSASADAALVEELAAQIGATFLPLDANYGYAGGNNAGIAAALAAGHEAVLVLNNDVVVASGAVEVLRGRLAARQDLAACAPLVVAHGTGAVLHSDCDLDLGSGSIGWSDHGRTPAEVGEGSRATGYVSGEAFLARAEALRECGAFDERFFLTFEDTEWSARVRRAGWTLETCAEAVVVHRHGATMGSVTSAYYKHRNYPLFLHVALGVPRPLAVLRGVSFASRAFLFNVKRRRWATALRGVLRGLAASAPNLVRASAGRPTSGADRAGALR
jgi:GT2 family glycosyltransferase